MPSTFGNTLRVSVFGQSHSPAIGCVIEGLPEGFAIDQERLQSFMARRAPGNNSWSTPRKEADLVHIVSGLNQQGTTCAAPLTALIENTNTRSQDYKNVVSIPRPGHADLSAQIKWGGHQDVAGGGHFSGRLTAPLCIAGGIALQILDDYGVHIAAHIKRIGDACDSSFSALDNSPEATQTLKWQMETLGSSDFPTIDTQAKEQMLAAIDVARRELDSVGGSIECVAEGLPAGVGSPMFDGLENMLARALFGIPAVKGVEFGRGFEVARLRGSENNDPYEVRDGQICPVSNNAGGILGGISTGAPLLMHVALKPTPSIAQDQQSVDLNSHEPTTLSIKGRHDPCVVVRAVPVVEAVCACVVLDALLTYSPKTV